MLFNGPGAKAQAFNGRAVGERTAEGQSRPATAHSYRAEEPRFRKITDPSGKYVRMLIPGHHHTSETGMPELPVYSRLVEVPEGTEVIVSLSGISSRRIRLTDQGAGGVELFPAQPARTKNETQDEKVNFKDKKVYGRRGIISHDTVVISYEGIHRGRRLANIAVYPAFYDPKGGYVDLITSMEMDIRFEPSPVKGVEENSVKNDKGGYASDAYVPGYSDKPVQMIIVTDSAFTRHLAPLVRWKLLKGIRTTVICKTTGSADTVYHDLKRRISEVWFNSLDADNPVQYLLIVGDPAIIPTAKVTANVSDLYYGEFDGDGDYIPELFIGRLPVSDTTQLKGMVKKIINYETWNYGLTNDFWSGALATAGNAPGFELYMNGQVKYIYNTYLGKDTSLNAVGWLYPEAQLKDDSLKTLFNKGLSILNYTGHGEAAGFSDPQFRASMVNGLTNANEYPLIIANACRTAQINVTPCFGTSMVNASDKGAIGYIGCTNDSYWVDDFFWAVGPGTPELEVTYETSGIGAFDRLFHTHEEPPGQWYHTMGQINFSGNLSVSASTSPRKKYYWETYILLGDPSLSPVIGRPEQFNVEIPGTIPQELTSLSFFADPFSYAALSDFDNLWDARFVSPSGSISLAIPPGVKDSCLLVITGQNKLPFIKTIYFGAVPGAFLTVENTVLDDFGGNGNGIAEYGETIRLVVTLKNLGQSESVQIQAGISTTSDMITIESATASIGSLLPGASFTILGDFIFSVSDQVEDGELASLLLTLTDNTKQYKFGIDMTLHAPQLEILSSVHDDLNSGNANFLPDPGETINLIVKVKNEGSSAASGHVTITPSGPLLSLQESELPTGVIAPGEEKSVSFEALISDLALSGTVIPYNVRFVCGYYEAEGAWSLSTGKTRETWEFNRFDVFPWIQRPEYPWTITSSSAFENVLSARSGIIPDKNETVLSIYVNNPVADTISFYSRTSSEPIYDELIFMIDSVVEMSISGDTPWTLRKKLLKPGVHLLAWIYKKDVSLSGGLDAA
ncbi:MAG: C25 family cysteine peptidase, partial [Bacteroidales bacterium]|nr:C25 family cysteine peptidase [Bacteroidales bacterium]